MESISYLERFGECVRNERTKIGLNQVEFYKFLFPDTQKNDENIKKKMNAIENGKQKSVDFCFLTELCNKCDVSADFLLGRQKNFRNHDTEFICGFTGLDENVVLQLHKWNEDKNSEADLSLIGSAFWRGEDKVMKAYVKQSAQQFLKIINYLFKEGKRTAYVNERKRTIQYSNLSIIHSIYLMSMAKPKTLTGKILWDDNEEFIREELLRTVNLSERITLDASVGMTMTDDSDVLYAVCPQELLQQIGRNQLNRNIDSLIDQIREDEKKEV